MLVHVDKRVCYLTPVICLEEMGNSMIETEILMLSPVTLEDIDIYEKLLTCAETTRYFPGGRSFSLECVQNYVPSKVAHWPRDYGAFIVALKDKPSQKIGYAGIELISESNFSVKVKGTRLKLQRQS